MHRPASTPPCDDRIPIGPQDCISMHRSRAYIAQAPVCIQSQPHIDALDMIVGRRIKGFESQINRLVKKHFIFHSQILKVWAVEVYSCFPSDFFIHGANVAAMQE